MEYERSGYEEKLFRVLMERKVLFIRGTVKTKMLVQVRRKLQTSMKEAGLTM
jgi:hypothetical protein